MKRVGGVGTPELKKEHPRMQNNVFASKKMSRDRAFSSVQIRISPCMNLPLKRRKCMPRCVHPSIMSYSRRWLLVTIVSAKPMIRGSDGWRADLAIDRRVMSRRGGRVHPSIQVMATQHRDRSTPSKVSDKSWPEHLPNLSCSRVRRRPVKPSTGADRGAIAGAGYRFLDERTWAS
jgi:hypothetical protein